MPTTTAPATMATMQEQFTEQGFARLGRVLDDAALAAIRADEAWLRGAQTDDRGKTTLFWCQTAKSCPGVHRLGLDGPHLDVVQALLGPDLVWWWNQFVTKLPDRDDARGQFPWHQDNGYVDIVPGPNATVWIALDDVDERNGCVWVVPGSHHQGLLPHDKPNADSWHLQVPVSEPGIPVPLKAGEAVCFSGYMLHRSLANRSDRPRRALFLEYATAQDRMRCADERNGQRVLSLADACLVRGRAARGE